MTDSHVFALTGRGGGKVNRCREGLQAPPFVTRDSTLAKLKGDPVLPPCRDPRNSGATGRRLRLTGQGSREKVIEEARCENGEKKTVVNPGMALTGVN